MILPPGTPETVTARVADWLADRPDGLFPADCRVVVRIAPPPAAPESNDWITDRRY